MKYNNPKSFQNRTAVKVSLLPLSSEVVDFAANISKAVGFAAAAFEFQNIPDPLSSEAVGITTAA